MAVTMVRVTHKFPIGSFVRYMDGPRAEIVGVRWQSHVTMYELRYPGGGRIVTRPITEVDSYYEKVVIR